MIGNRVIRDEREAGVDLAADRLSYLVLAYGLLAAIAYRAFGLGQSSWDLLALVVLSGAIGMAYRLRARVATRGWTVAVLGTMVIGAILAVGLALATGAR
jgi:hypothetical protein